MILKKVNFKEDVLFTTGTSLQILTYIIILIIKNYPTNPIKFIIYKRSMNGLSLQRAF